MKDENRRNCKLAGCMKVQPVYFIFICELFFFSISINLSVSLGEIEIVSYFP